MLQVPSSWKFFIAVCPLKGGLQNIRIKIMDSSLRLPLCSVTFLLLMLVSLENADAQLSYGYYDNTCPNAEAIARRTLQASILTDPTAPAALVRLAFHDCQVDGCDASIMLTSGLGVSDELRAPSSLGIRRLNLIDRIKSALESVCPQTVSCADIIALAGRDAVAIAGGPRIDIPLGRLDGFRASASAAQQQLPIASISVSNFLSLFGRVGMSVEESVAIIGGHTLGIAHCPSIVNRLYPVQDPNIGLLFAAKLRARCPPLFTINQVFVDLDSTTRRFDNQYFQGILQGRGLLTIDSELGLDPRTSGTVARFADDVNSFFDAFTSAYVKLTSQGILRGGEGEVRVNCRATN